MGGGSYDYAYRYADDMACQLQVQGDPLRRAFGKHLALVAKAMHDIEWVDSGDFGTGDEREAIEAVLAPGAELSAGIEVAEQIVKTLNHAISRAKAGP